jgi:hypothetical protein
MLLQRAEDNGDLKPIEQTAEFKIEEVQVIQPVHVEPQMKKGGPLSPKAQITVKLEPLQEKQKHLKHPPNVSGTPEQRKSPVR